MYFHVIHILKTLYLYPSDFYITNYLHTLTWWTLIIYPKIRELTRGFSSLVAQMVKNLSAMPETQVRSLDSEDPLAKGIATHSSILAWRIPWTDEPGGLQSMGSQSGTRLRDWRSLFCIYLQVLLKSLHFRGLQESHENTLWILEGNTSLKPQRMVSKTSSCRFRPPWGDPDSILAWLRGH